MSDDNNQPSNVFQLLQGGIKESDESLRIVKENAPSLAQSLFIYFNELKKVGFDAYQALQITIATFFRSN